MANRLWESYWVGFPARRASPSDYPYTGHPFIGIGWSYNWADAAGKHHGVSEFVVRCDAVIKIVSEKEPADFCGKPGTR